MNTRSPRFWVILCGVIFALMVGASYAAVPLYDLFCKVTGYGGTTQTAAAKPARIKEIDRPIEVRFDTNVAPGLALEFKADETRRIVNLGQTALAFFRVKNVGTEPIEAVATYNVTPHKTGIYFQKLECFCFQPRVFQPGETLELPVVFYVDPELADDLDTKEVEEITLSYTYYAKPDAERAPKTAGKRADLAPSPGRDVARPRLGAPGDAG
jgi:cytochrome c oxidase assembly protein subunit 11